MLWDILQEAVRITVYAIDLNQGMDARLVTDKIAVILANLKWIKYIRFSCDSIPQIEAIHNAAALLEKYGVKPYRLYIYLLVTSEFAQRYIYGGSYRKTSWSDYAKERGLL